jgi:hypothetical protein
MLLRPLGIGNWRKEIKRRRLLCSRIIPSKYPACYSLLAYAKSSPFQMHATTTREFVIFGGISRSKGKRSPTALPGISLTSATESGFEAGR